MTAPDTTTDDSSSPQVGQETPPSAADDLSPEGMRAELKRARDEAAKYRQRARDNAEAQSKLDAIEQSKKSEMERLTEEKDGLARRATSAEDGLTRLRVALGAGVPADRVDEFASRLRGDTEEDLVKDAATLATFFAAPSAPARRGDPSQAAGTDGSPVTADPFQAALEAKLGIPH